jgi:alkanesulfonate monooxygenase SsuD/methylene tetrahydromethanopterin reductase-like flavin-dependent oxidoreductase (luciferase family)
MTHYSIVGGPQRVRQGIEQLLAATQADEIITTGSMFDHAARLRSFEITAEVFGQINAARQRQTIAAAVVHFPRTRNP